MTESDSYALSKRKSEENTDTEAVATTSTSNQPSLAALFLI